MKQFFIRSGEKNKEKLKALKLACGAQGYLSEVMLQKKKKTDC